MSSKALMKAVLGASALAIVAGFGSAPVAAAESPAGGSLRRSPFRHFGSCLTCKPSPACSARS